MQSKSKKSPSKSPVRLSNLNSKIALATNMDEDISSTLQTRTNAASIAKEALKQYSKQGLDINTLTSNSAKSKQTTNWHFGMFVLCSALVIAL